MSVSTWPSSRGPQPNPFLLAAEAWGERGAIDSRWYCDDLECNGEPHEGWHWCVHPICPKHGGSSEADPECAACRVHDPACRHARVSQRPPASFEEGKARIWLVMAGRGWGKSKTGSEWLAHRARMADAVRSRESLDPPTEWGLVAPTFRDLRRTCIEGESGLLYAFRDLRFERGFDYNRSNLEITLPNGTKVLTFSADTPERVRGPNLSGVWMDEIAQNQGRYPETYRLLTMAIRRHGEDCQFVCTTTPAPVPLVREFTDRDDGSVVVTQGRTFDNRVNLSDAFIEDMEVRYRGTRFEKQELFGELLEDVPGALWSPSLIEGTRMKLAGGPGRMIVHES